MGIRNYYHNTVETKKAKSIVESEELFNGVLNDRKQDMRLSRTIVTDMEYGVGNRPTLPSCYDDEEFYKSGQIDSAVDIRHSVWDDLADACSPVAKTPESSKTEVDSTPQVVEE